MSVLPCLLSFLSRWCEIYQLTAQRDIWSLRPFSDIISLNYQYLSLTHLSFILCDFSIMLDAVLTYVATGCYTRETNMLSVMHTGKTPHLLNIRDH